MASGDYKGFSCTFFCFLLGYNIQDKNSTMLGDLMLVQSGIPTQYDANQLCNNYLLAKAKTSCFTE